MSDKSKWISASIEKGLCADSEEEFLYAVEKLKVKMNEHGYFKVWREWQEMCVKPEFSINKNWKYRKDIIDELEKEMGKL